MKIYLDSLNLSEIEEYKDIIAGITTVPGFALREQVRYDVPLIIKIREILGKHKEIHYALIEQNINIAIEKGKKLFQASGNDEQLVLKIPLTFNGIKISKELRKHGIKTGMHLIFSVNQAILATEANADYIYPLCGKQDDIGRNGTAVIKDIVSAYKINNEQTKIIAASIRHPMHVIELYSAGIYAVTVPSSVLKKMIEHPLTNINIKTFREDYEKSK